VLLDSNIIIYSTNPLYDSLQIFIAQNDCCVSLISKLEVLGFQNLQEKDKKILEAFFETAETIIPISDSIIEKAIQLRQQRKMSLGDAIIAATALEYNLTLVTANTKDFNWITSLNITNPLYH